MTKDNNLFIGSLSAENMGNSIKLGVKTFQDKKFLQELEGRADFFEIMAIKGKDYSFLREFSKPIVIHAEHQRFGVNYADNAKCEKNLQSLEFALGVAREYNSQKVIVHAGRLENDGCSIAQAVSLIRSINDERVLIENLPQNYFCSTPEDIRRFISLSGCSFCFDINHAIQTALSNNLEPYGFIERFIELNPRHYHLGGQKMNSSCIGHKSFRDSEMDMEKIMKIIPDRAEITLEVTTDVENTKYDVDFVRRFTK